MAEDRRTPDTPAERPQDPDQQIEDLTRRIAEVVNSAGAEARHDLRDYAIGLLKDETETMDAAAELAGERATPTFNLLAMALLLVLASLPLLLSVVFAPVGLAVLALAAVMGIWGILAVVFRR